MLLLVPPGGIKPSTDNGFDAEVALTDVPDDVRTVAGDAAAIAVSVAPSATAGPERSLAVVLTTPTPITPAAKAAAITVFFPGAVDRGMPLASFVGESSGTTRLGCTPQPISTTHSADHGCVSLCHLALQIRANSLPTDRPGHALRGEFSNNAVVLSGRQRQADNSATQIRFRSVTGVSDYPEFRDNTFRTSAAGGEFAPGRTVANWVRRHRCRSAVEITFEIPLTRRSTVRLGRTAPTCARGCLLW